MDLRQLKAGRGVTALILGGGLIFCLGIVLMLSSCVSGSSPEERSHTTILQAAATREVIPANPDSFSFIAVGDTHLAGGIEVGRLRTIFSEGVNQGAEFAVILGDVIDRGRWENYDTLIQLRDEVGWSDRVFPILGNHDIFGDCWKHYNERFGPSYYTFTVGNSKFIALDTSDGTLGATQWDWFLKELQSNSQQHIFVLTHYMPIVPGVQTYLKMPAPREAARLMSACRRYGVRAVLGGHYHSLAQATIEGVHYLVAGGGGARRMGVERRHFYVQVGVQGDEVTYTTHFVQ